MNKHKAGKNAMLLLFLALGLVLPQGAIPQGTTAEAEKPPVVLAQPGWDLSNKATEDASVRRALGLAPTEQLFETSDFPMIHRKELQIETQDGVLMGATYTHTHMKQEAPLAILIHEEKGNRRDFDEYAQVLRTNGISTLAIDLRGHGESRKLKNGDEIRFEDFNQDVESDSYRQMIFDLEAALDWAYNEDVVDPQGVFIIASKMGATVGCMSAIPNTHRLKGMVMVNAQAFFRKINLKDELSRIQGLPILVIASDGDTYGQTIPRTLNQVNPEVRPLIIPLKFVGIPLLMQPETQKEVVKFIQDRS